MFELKPLSESAIPRAMAKAERYRLLNEPQEADSICRDILSADPDNQEISAVRPSCLLDHVRSIGVSGGLSSTTSVVAKLRDWSRGATATRTLRCGWTSVWRGIESHKSSIDPDPDPGASVLTPSIGMECRR